MLTLRFSAIFSSQITQNDNGCFRVVNISETKMRMVILLRQKYVSSCIIGFWMSKHGNNETINVPMTKALLRAFVEKVAKTCIIGHFVTGRKSAFLGQKRREHFGHVWRGAIKSAVTAKKCIIKYHVLQLQILWSHCDDKVRSC